MKILETMNENQVTDEEMVSFSRRSSTRAIMLGHNGNVGLLYSQQLDYYTLPGGGVEIGETGEQSVVRECLEETGYVVEIVATLGAVLEIRKDVEKISEVLGYVVQIVGEQGETQLMPDEIEEGFVVKWIPQSQVKDIFHSEMSRAKPEHQQIPKRALVFLNHAFPGV
jgi:ADP-ribose pyrophosphatase YjhB (NUDIX family)